LGLKLQIKENYFSSCAPNTFCGILVVLNAGVLRIPLSFSATILKTSLMVLGEKV